MSGDLIVEIAFLQFHNLKQRLSKVFQVIAKEISTQFVIAQSEFYFLWCKTEFQQLMDCFMKRNGVRRLYLN